MPCPQPTISKTPEGRGGAYKDRAGLPPPPREPIKQTSSNLASGLMRAGQGRAMRPSKIMYVTCRCNCIDSSFPWSLTAHKSASLALSVLFLLHNRFCAPAFSNVQKPPMAATQPLQYSPSQKTRHTTEGQPRGHQYNPPLLPVFHAGYHGPYCVEGAKIVQVHGIVKLAISELCEVP